MKRPALTRKMIDNLKSLRGFAVGEMENYDHRFGDTKLGTDPLTRDAHAAVEWITRVSIWKTEQEKKRKELRK
tara:strand:+ start:315 stop:533 length:219 start_codon:yes stop_codon:yes gene_type:complete